MGEHTLTLRRLLAVTLVGAGVWVGIFAAVRVIA